MPLYTIIVCRQFFNSGISLKFEVEDSDHRPPNLPDPDFLCSPFTYAHSYTQFFSATFTQKVTIVVLHASHFANAMLSML